MNFTLSRAIDRFGEWVADRKGSARSITLYVPLGIVYAAKELRQARIEFVGRQYPTSIGVNPDSTLTFSLAKRNRTAYAEDDGDARFERLGDAAQTINSYAQLRVGNSVGFSIREVELLDTESIYLRVVAAGNNVNTSVWYHVDSLMVGMDWWDGNNPEALKMDKPNINFETIGPRR